MTKTIELRVTVHTLQNGMMTVTPYDQESGKLQVPVNLIEQMTFMHGNGRPALMTIPEYLAIGLGWKIKPSPLAGAGSPSPNLEAALAQTLIKDEWDRNSASLRDTAGFTRAPAADSDQTRIVSHKLTATEAAEIQRQVEKKARHAEHYQAGSGFLRNHSIRPAEEELREYRDKDLSLE